MKTYHLRGGVRQTIVEALAQARRVLNSDSHALAMELVSRRDVALSRIYDTYGISWSGLSLLDVGSGQRCPWSLLFGSNNYVTAIDYEVIPRGFDLPVYWSMLRTNGLQRTCKTILRKAIGVDRRIWRDLQVTAGRKLTWPNTYRMDCQNLELSTGSFDGAFSFSVFEHLSDPRQGMREINRVLRPGGVAYISLELFTSIAGSHDPRLWGNPLACPPWAHLRPTCAHMSCTNVQLNRLRMNDFIQMAGDTFADSVFFRDERSTRCYLSRLAPSEREELSDFSDEELCTQDFVILGRKAR